MLHWLGVSVCSSADCCKDPRLPHQKQMHSNFQISLLHKNEILTCSQQRLVPISLCDELPYHLKKIIKNTSGKEHNLFLSVFHISPLTAEGASMSASKCLMLNEWNPPWSSTAEANIITYKVFSGSNPEVIEDSVMKGAIHLSITTWKQTCHMLVFLVEWNCCQRLMESYFIQTKLTDC